jgi:hypothetical protein
MRKVLLLFVLMPCLAFTQDCKSLFEVVRDKFTKQDYLYGKIQIVSNNGKTIQWQMSVDEYRGNPRCPYLMVTAIQDGVLNCIDFDAEILLLLENGKKISLHNATKYNCDGSVVFLFKTIGSGSKEFIKHLKILSKTKVEAIRMPFSAGKYDYELTRDQSSVLLTAFQCANANAKK